MRSCALRDKGTGSKDGVTAWEASQLAKEERLEHLELLLTQTQEDEIHVLSSIKTMSEYIRLLTRRISLLEDICKEQVDVVSVFLIPGQLDHGIRIDWDRGVVMYLQDRCTARIEGVDVGWYVHMIENQRCTKQGWDERVAKGNPFKVSFQRPRQLGLQELFDASVARMQGMRDKLDNSVAHRLDKILEFINEQRQSVLDAMDSKFDSVDQHIRSELDAMGQRMEFWEGAVRVKLQNQLEGSLARSAETVRDAMCLVASLKEEMNVASLKEEMNELRTRLDDVCSTPSAHVPDSACFNPDTTAKVEGVSEMTTCWHVQSATAESPKPCALQGASRETKHGDNVPPESHGISDVFSERSEIGQPGKRIMESL